MIYFRVTLILMASVTSANARLCPTSDRLQVKVLRQRESSCSNTSQLINGATGSLSTGAPLLSGRDATTKLVGVCAQNIVLEIWIDLPGGAGLWLYDSSELNRVIVIKC